MDDDEQNEQLAAQTIYPKAKQMWLSLSNVCAKGQFRITLEIDGKPHKVWQQYVNQDEGCIVESWNLTGWLAKHNHYIEKQQAELEALQEENKLLKDVLDDAVRFTDVHCEALVETCGECLSDGRGTHGEQLEHSIDLYFKAVDRRGQ